MRPDRQALLDAQARLAAVVHRTPVLTSQTIDLIAGARLFFKCENLQKTGSFKLRGATNAIERLTPAEASRGVATHSSGNYAQALAYAAGRKGLRCRVVMPTSAPAAKREATRTYGAEIIDCEPTLRAREATLQRVVEETGAVFLHPYDHDDVIAGQATACLELLESVRDLDAVVAPVGGGGLISGTALAAHFFAPHTRVVGGEPTGADDACRSLQAGRIVPSVNPTTIADGLLTSLGERTFPIIRDHVERIVTVTDTEIIAALRLIWERLKLVVEPSAAVALAAVLKRPDRFADRRVGVILSGGNVDLARLPF